MSNSVSNHHNIFKDKKLNKLWLKAESAGFTGSPLVFLLIWCNNFIFTSWIAETELKTLKEEFVHHQEKVLEFYGLLEEHNSRKLREESKMNPLFHHSPNSFFNILTFKITRCFCQWSLFWSLARSGWGKRQDRWEPRRPRSQVPESFVLPMNFHHNFHHFTWTNQDLLIASWNTATTGWNAWLFLDRRVVTLKSRKCRVCGKLPWKVISALRNWNLCAPSCAITSNGCKNCASFKARRPNRIYRRATWILTRGRTRTPTHKSSASESNCNRARWRNCTPIWKRASLKGISNCRLWLS